jgi:hypothetical protein
MTTIRALAFAAAALVLPAVAAAAPDDRAADCRAAPAREEPAPHVAREGDPRETRRDLQERREEVPDCDGPSWRSRIPGMLR